MDQEDNSMSKADKVSCQIHVATRPISKDDNEDCTHALKSSRIHPGKSQLRISARSSSSYLCYDLQHEKQEEHWALPMAR